MKKRRRGETETRGNGDTGKRRSLLTTVSPLLRVVFLIIVVCILFLNGCTKKENIYRKSLIAMDTFCTITVISPSREKAEEAIDAGFEEIKKLEGLLNYFSTDSEVTAINKSSGMNPVRVSKETLDIIKKAVDIADYTNGAFNPAIGSVMKLWGFSGQASEPSVPPKGQVRKMLRFVDYKKIKINTSTSEIFLEEKGMELDVGGIAKGYAADKAIEVIKAKGIKAALVAIAGDIKGFGLKPDTRPWKVGVQNPRPDGDSPEPPRTGDDFKGRKGGLSGEDIFASLYLEDNAISTSGDYQRFFIKQGKRYHHILNPATGYPASDVISVSVIALEGYMADAISTGVFVLGPDKGIKLLESMGLDGIIVDADKKILITKNLKGEVNIEKPL